MPTSSPRAVRCACRGTTSRASARATCRTCGAAWGSCSRIPARVMRVLTQVGLAAKAGAYPRELSGGEQQRVAIARALVNEPQVLLADEPTGNLDERATRGVFQLLRDINASGTAVVMATHDLELVRSAPYRVIELQDGAVVYDSAVDEAAAGGE